MAVTTLAIPGAQAANADVTVTLPGSIPDDSLALIRVEFNPSSGGTNTVTMPAGWTLVRNQVFSTSFHSNLYAKAVGPSDSGASVLVDVTSTTSKTCAYGVVLVGADIADLDDVAFVDVSASATTHANPATSATPAPARVAVSFCGTRGSAAVTTIIPPAGFTAVASAYNTGSGACAGMVAVNLTEDSDGNVGGGTWGLRASGTPAAQGAALYTLAIAAAVSVSTVDLTSAVVPVTAPAVQPVGQVNLAPATVTLTARPAYPTAVVNLAPALVTGSARPLSFQTPVQLLPARVILAHRGGPTVPNNGASGPRPQNTYAALLKMAAYDHPKTVFECDLAWLGAGGGATDEQRMALTHAGDNLAEDNNVFNDSAGAVQTTGTAASLTYAQWKTKWIKTDSAISPAAYAPATSWDEIADWLQANPTRVAAPEAKDPATVQPLIDSVITRGLIGQIIAQSFTYSECVTMAAAGLNVSWNTNTLTSTTAGNAYAAGIRYVGVDRTITDLAGYCATAAAAGLDVLVYTVNNSTNRDIAFGTGARGIFTNRPDILNNLGGLDLTPAGAGVSAVAVTPVPGSVTVNLQPATTTILAPATGATPGPGTVNLQPCAVSSQPVAVAPTPGQAVVALQPAAANVSAQPVTFTTAGTVNLAPALVTGSAQPVTPAPGQVAVALLPAVLAVTGVQLANTPAGQVSLQPAAVGAASTPVTPTPGQVALALAVVTVLLQGQPVAPAATGGVVSLQPALVTVQGKALTSAPGSVTVTLQAAAVLFLAVALQPPTGDVEPLRILAVGRPRPAVVGILRER